MKKRVSQFWDTFFLLKIACFMLENYNFVKINLNL